MTELGGKLEGEAGEILESVDLSWYVYYYCKLYVDLENWYFIIGELVVAEIDDFLFYCFSSHPIAVLCVSLLDECDSYCFVCRECQIQTKFD